MTALDRNRARAGRLLWLAMALAMLTSLAYLLIVMNALGVGDLQVVEDGGAIVYVAAGCYALGGLLILARRRWLWLLGGVMNALVMAFFFSMYQDRPAVLLSPGGLTTKVAQIALEIALIALIVAEWRAVRRQERDREPATDSQPPRTPAALAR